ncbi:MAG TPA: hypothetical protein DIC60_02700 [Lachnospiraceae bacterium]|nr:hypothetical protein [Lachnospiraceae bacterium]
MEKKNVCENKDYLNSLCRTVRELIGNQDYGKGEILICDAMGRYPHAPAPHNLIGILLEKTGNHLSAMKHFRAALMLDPTYLPARKNLEGYGTFYSNGKCFYDENDCILDESTGNGSSCKIEYDTHETGRIIRRNTYETINKQTRI